MAKLKVTDLSDYVEKHIGTFHEKRLAVLSNLRLNKVLQKKNPYLFKAKYVLTSQEIVTQIVDARLSSSEESIFGDWLEGLAIHINQIVFGGRKSGIPGVDLEFDHGEIRYIVTIKSGPDWGNDSQVKKMKADFTSAKKVLRTSNSKIQVVAVNGCCYGRSAATDKGEYFKYCGERFWTFISGEANLFLSLIEPLSHRAREKNDEYVSSYAKMINLFTQEFSNNFCFKNGEIDWVKIVRINSGIEKLGLQTSKDV